MLNLAILRKTIYESRWLFLCCAFILFVFCLVHVTVTSQISMGQFETLLDNVPSYFEDLFPVEFKKLMTYQARIALTYEEPLLFLIMTLWCVTRSSDVVSGELGRGTMEMTLSQPVTRLQVMMTPVLVTLCGVILLSLIAWAGTCAGISINSIDRPPPDSSFQIPFTSIKIPKGVDPEEMETIPLRQLVKFTAFLPAVANYGALGIFLAGVCTMLSSLDRYRWRTIGMFMGFYVLQMLAEILGNAFPDFRWAHYLTFFRAYEPIKFVSEAVQDHSLAWAWFLRDASGKITDIGPMMGNAILVGFGLVGILLAGTIFSQRDLPAPI